MRFYKLLIFITLLFLAGAPLQGQSRQVRKKIAKAEQVEKKQKRQEKREQKQNVKEHLKMQTKETRGRMKETDKRAAKFNKRNDKSILNRIFNKRQRKARKKYG